jgi:hypothetical protein
MENIELKDPSADIQMLFSLKEWRQRIHLEGELYTPGTRCDYEWDMCNLPADLKGQSFIDVGANDGMFSFLAEAKGAKRVKAVDLYVENTESDMTGGWPINRIKTVIKAKKSSVDVERCSLMELNKLNEKFDVVFCGNVVTYLTDVIEGIKQLTNITNKKLIIREDLSDIKGKPALEFINTGDLNYNMYRGNREYYQKLLAALGYKKITFHPVDEYKIFEMRYAQFPKHDIPAGVKVYNDPFTDDIRTTTEQRSSQAVSMKVNNRHFFSTIGWVDSTKSAESKIKMIPENSLRKKIFENKFRKNMLQNCMIFAEK